MGKDYKKAFAEPGKTPIFQSSFREPQFSFPLRVQPGESSIHSIVGYTSAEPSRVSSHTHPPRIQAAARFHSDTSGNFTSLSPLVDLGEVLARC
jgi:hypothetical protein